MRDSHKYTKLTNPLPLLKLGADDNVIFKTYIDPRGQLPRLTTQNPECLKFVANAWQKPDNNYHVQIHFSSGNVEHLCTCSDEQQGWLTAYVGAYALAYEGVENPPVEPWINNVEIEDSIGSSAWVTQHIDSPNYLLRRLALRALKDILTLEDSCI